MKTLKAILKILLAIFFWPIKWFVPKYKEYKETNDKKQFGLNLTISIAVLLVQDCCLILLIDYIGLTLPILLLFIAVIIFLYAYSISKEDDKPVEPMAPQTAPIDYDLLDQKAFARKDLITNIMYKCFREVAAKLRCNVPIREEEIYMQNNWYRYGDNFVIFLFRLEKEDMKAPWNIELRNEYTIVVESKLQHMISSNMFKGIGYPVARDRFGDTLRRIYVFDIADEGQYLYIYVVFGCPEYQEYLNRTNSQTITPLDESVPNATWDEFNF